MATDTIVNNLIINKLTKAQYYDIENPSETEIYLVPDEIDDVPTENSVNTVKSGGVYTALAGKQGALVSGTNIKTINNESLLGSGNISIQGGGGDTNVIETVKVNGTALTPDANKAVDVTVPTALSSLTDDSTHRLVTDTEKSTWNSKAEIFIQDIDCSNIVNGEKIISGTTIYNAIDAAYRAGKQVWVRWTNGAQPLQPMIPLTMYDAQFGYAFGYNLINDNMQSCYMVSVTTAETDIYWVQLGLYSMPSTGIPAIDLASAVQTSLGKADTALQSFTETDPVFAASAAHGITSSDITNWNGKTSNTGTITGITMNGASKGTSGVVDLGTVITSETTLSKGTTTGAGNAVTDISVSGHEITLTKGTTFLTSETTLSKGTTTGAGNVVTDISVSGHTITLTKGSTIPTVNNPTITLTFNGSTVGTFTLNQSSNQSIDIGSIIGLPSYSSSNNGQILGVVNGQLTWVTPTTIYTGTSTPSNSQGNDGDIYLQTN